MLRLGIAILVLGGALLSAEDPWIGAWKLVWATASQDNHPRVALRRTAVGELQFQPEGQPVLRMRQVDQHTAEGTFGRGRQAGTVRCTSNGQELTVLWVSFYEKVAAADASGAVAAAPPMPQVAPPAPAAPAATLTDDQVWAEFEQWAETLKPLPPGQGGEMQSYRAYVEALIARGVPREEAERRNQRVATLRRGSVERERVLWNALFKLNAGPSSPLRLLQEAVRLVKPGRALDAGMGRGRNAIYLASLGWETHGYDISAGGLEAAQAAAKVAGVKLTTTKGAHDDFDFGKSRWDLIVCSYNYMSVTDKKWPGLLFEALRPGGLVVFQTANQQPMDWRQVLDNWKQFQILRLEDQDPGYVDDDWSPSRTIRTTMLVARKEQ